MCHTTKNCPNCGAVIDYEKSKCSFCGTQYYDLACMSMGEPFYIRVNMAPYSDKTILARAVLETIELETQRDEYSEISMRLHALRLKEVGTDD